MKTIRIILIAVGVALTSITYGQLLSHTDGGILFYKMAYNSTKMRIEHHLDEYPYIMAYGDQFESNMASRTYFAPMEIDVAVESWMMTPFESNDYEIEPKIESWMTEPFDLDEEIEIEAWMTQPFLERC